MGTKHSTTMRLQLLLGMLCMANAHTLQLHNHVDRVLRKLHAVVPETATNATTHFYDSAVLDHFLASVASPKASKWSQRYYVDQTHWCGAGCPIFVYIGGEGPQGPPSSRLFMSTLAAEAGAMTVALEHRFFGESYPTPDMSSAPTESVSCHQQIRDIRRVVSWQLGCVVQIEISSAHSRLCSEQRTGVCRVQLRAIRSSSWRCTRQPWHRRQQGMRISTHPRRGSFRQGDPHRRLRRDWSDQTRRLPMLTQVGLYHTHLFSCCWSASWQPNMWWHRSCAARAETMHCAQQYTRHSAVPIVCFRPIPRGRPIQRRNTRPDSQLHLCCCGGSVSPSRGTGSRRCCDTWCGCERCALCCIQL